MKSNKKKVVLDLRPLQTSYAMRGIGFNTRELASRVYVYISQKPNFPYQLLALIMENSPHPLPQLPVFYRMPYRKRPWLWDQTVLAFLLWSKRIYRLHNFVALGPLPEISYPVLFAKRSLLTILDWHMFDEDATAIEQFYRQTWRIRLQKFGLPWAYKIIVISEHGRTETLKYLCSTDSTKKIITVPLGCDQYDLLPAASISESQGFILSIGDTANKNLSFAFKILLALKETAIDLHWIIIGSPTNIISQFTAINIDLTKFAWIKILEKISAQELKAYYQHAVCLLFPSTKEGFGNPVLEAMRAGCPVVTSSIPSIKEIVGEAFTTYDLENAVIWKMEILKLLNDQSYRQTKMEHGVARSEKFLWKNSIAKIEKIYLE